MSEMAGRAGGAGAAEAAHGTRREKGRRRPGRDAQAKRFFAAYFAVILLFFLWNLTHCTTVSWIGRDAFLSVGQDAGEDSASGAVPAAAPEAGDADASGTGALVMSGKGTASSADGTDSADASASEAVAVLTDADQVVVRCLPEAGEGQGNGAQAAVPAKARLRGAALLGYGNPLGLRYTEETVYVQVADAQSGEVLGSGSMPLKNQSPYPNDETSLYIALEEPVKDAAGRALEARFTSSGLARNGISFAGGAAGEGGAVPAARLYYEKRAWNPLTAILYFLAEAAAGLGCLVLYGRRIVPLRNIGGDRADQLQAFQAVGSDAAENPRRRGERKPGREEKLKPGREGKRKPGRQGSPLFLLKRKYLKLAPLAVLFACSIAVMGAVYLRVVRKLASACDAEILVSIDGADGEAVLSEGAPIRQRIVLKQDGLAGFGICLAEGEHSSLALAWKLLDGTGQETLAQGSAPVKELQKAAGVLEKDLDDQELLRAAQACRFLPLDEAPSGLAGRDLLLELSVMSAGDASEEGEAGQAGISAEMEKTEGIPADGEAKTQISLLAYSGTNGQLDRAGQGSEGTELCLMAAYRNNGFFKGFYLFICLALLAGLSGLYLLAFAAPGRRSGERLALMYLCSALVMGFLFSFMTPAYTISDERTHVDSVYIVSNRLLGITDIPGPSKEWKRACDIDTSIANTMPVKAARYRAVAEGLLGAAAGSRAPADNSTGNIEPVTAKTLVPAYTRNALANVPILCYLPAAIGFTAARLLGRNMITMVMFARWANLLACAGILCLAIRRMPYGGTCLAVIGLFPKTLQLMASCSYDGMVIAGTWLFIACCLAAAFGRESIAGQLSGERTAGREASGERAADRKLSGGEASGEKAADGKLYGGRTSGRERAGQSAFGASLSAAGILILLLAGFFTASCKGGAYLPVLGLALLIPFAGNGGAGVSRRPFKRMGRTAGADGQPAAGGRSNGPGGQPFGAGGQPAAAGRGTEPGGQLPKAGGDRRGRLLRAGLAAAVLGGSLFLFLGKYVVRLTGMFSRVSGSASIAAGTRKIYTLSDFLHAPVKLVRIYFNTLQVRGDGLLGELVGKNLCQHWGFVFAFLLLALLGMLYRGEGAGRGEEPEGGAPGCAPAAMGLPARLWLLFLAACSTALVFLSMLLAFTAKGAAYIDGLQGRYFLPVVPLLFLAAENRAVRREGLPDGAILYAADVLLAVTFMEILLAYLGGS